MRDERSNIRGGVEYRSLMVRLFARLSEEVAMTILRKSTKSRINANGGQIDGELLCRVFCRAKYVDDIGRRNVEVIQRTNMDCDMLSFNKLQSIC